MMSAFTPYRLAFNEGWIFARGQDEILTSLACIPGSARIASTPGIAFPASRAAFLAAEALAAPVSVSSEYREARKAFLGVPLAWLADTEQAVNYPLPLARELKAHQVEFCALARGRRGMINASEQGVGKTSMGWMMAHLWGAQRVLIVAGNSFVEQWREEWEALWAGPRPFGVCVLGSDQGSISARGEKVRTLAITPGAWPCAIVTNYEAVADVRSGERRRAGLEGYIREYRPDCVILDESFMVKNPDAAVTKALTPICDAAAHVLCLTGTPIGNHAGDLYSQLRMLGPEVVPESYWEFLARYSHLRPVNVGIRQVMKPTGIRDPVGLMERIAPVWYRATKETCLDLPPKRHWPAVKLALPRETRELYGRVAEEGECALGNPLALSTSRVVAVRLHQIAGGHRPVWNDHLEMPDRDEDGAEMRRYQMEPLPCPKLEWLARFVRDALEGDRTRRLIVWVRYIHELKRIVETLGQIVNTQGVWGETRNAELAVIKDSFNSRDPDGIQVLIAQWSKFSYGHNVQSADWHVRFSHSWSYVENAQSEDRSHRLGREEPVDYVDLVATGTIDEEILAALNAKKSYAAHFGKDTTGEPDK